MSERSFGPVVVRRRLGAELRRLREAAGMSLDQAARTLEISASKLSRVETGHSPPKIWDVRNLLTVYGVTDEAYRRRAERWVGQGRAQGWWTPYSDASPADLDHFISLEAESAEILSFSTPVLYGLLQTEEYSRSLLRAAMPGLSDDEVEGLVSIRVGRRDVLLRDNDPIKLRAVVDEAALRRTIGGPTVMVELWRHLLRLSDRVDLRVVRSSVFRNVMMAPFTVFLPQLAALDPTVVNVEAGLADLYYEQSTDTQPYIDAFESLASDSLSSEKTRHLIEGLIEEGERK